MDCRQFFLHDLALPFLSFPRIYDDMESRDLGDSDKNCKLLYLRYLEACIEILTFMGEYDKMAEFSELLERKFQQFKGESKEGVLEVMKIGTGFTESSTPVFCRLICALINLDEKELRNSALSSKKAKDETIGTTDRLISYFGGKSNDAELIAEIKKALEKLRIFCGGPNKDALEELTNSHVGQRFGLTWNILQRIYFTQLKKNSDEARSLYLNIDDRSLFANNSEGLGSIKNVMLKACLVNSDHSDAWMAVRRGVKMYHIYRDHQEKVFS
jgi:hypothetical protein